MTSMDSLWSERGNSLALLPEINSSKRSVRPILSIKRKPSHSPLGFLVSGDAFERTRKCFFSIRHSQLPESTRVDLSGSLEEAVLQLRKEVPQELVVSIFQKLVRLQTTFPTFSITHHREQNLRRILFTNGGQLTGMTTKTDIVSLLTSHFPHAGALS